MSLNYSSVVKMALLYLVVWCISPPLSYGAIYRVAAVVAVAASLLIGRSQGRFQISRYQMYIILLIGYMFFVSWIAGDGINHRIGTYIFLFILIAAESLWDESVDISKFYFILPVVFFLAFFWNMRTLQGIEEVPNIMRLLAKNSDISLGYAKRGVGGYGYMYTLLLLLPIGLDCSLAKSRNLVFRLAAILFTVSTYILAFQSQYFLAVLIILLLTVLFFVFRVRDFRLRTTLMIMVLIGFVLLYINADKVLIYVRNLTDIRSFQMKIDDMYDVLVNDGSIADSEFYTRYDRYVESLKYAITHPLLGGFTYDITGNHSHILDYMAQFGIPLGIFYIGLVTEPLKRMHSQNSVCGFVMTIVFFIITIMNTVAYSFGAIIYIIAPIYFHYAKEREVYG